MCIELIFWRLKLCPTLHCLFSQQQQHCSKDPQVHVWLLDRKIIRNYSNSPR